MIPSYLTYIESAAREQPDLPAFKVPNTQHRGTATTHQSDVSRLDWGIITYRTCWEDIITRARYWLQVLHVEHSIPLGNVVTIWMHGLSYDDVLLTYALSRAGYVPQLVSLSIPTAETTWVVAQQSRSRAIICDPTKFDELRSHLHEKDVAFPVLDLSGSSPVAEDVAVELMALEQLERDDDAVALVLHTSGSTGGMPKIVPLTFGWLNFVLRHKDKFGNMGDSTRNKQAIHVWFGPACHSGQCLSQLYSFASRSCMLQPTTLAYDPAELTAMITLGGLTTSTQFSPFFARHIARARTDKVFLELLKQLETVFLGGLPLSEDDEIFCLQEGVKVQFVFASTECGVLLHTTAGKPLNWYTPMHKQIIFEPLPDDATPVDPDQHTHGASISDWQSPGNTSFEPTRRLLELVVLSFSKDCPVPSFRSASDGHFHTGDLFELVSEEDSNSPRNSSDNQAQNSPTFYRFRGRNDDWVKLANAGGRCDTRVIERNVMETCKDIVQACVVVGSGRPEFVLFVELLPSVAESTVASQPLSSPALSSTSAIKQSILTRLAPTQSTLWTYERLTNPDRIVVVPSGTLPRTVVKGNVRRGAVEVMFKDILDQMFNVERG
ncbi:hypothetical protein BDV98DRAFT_596877 [Pterulicium gracile]|uniref:AMP-dependent synthetase/ligase domain-containing protein n=1 Tax=Pterulicium gracile TaxID=1884261 RepID=A0A5C3QG22_9AGAR|nr:hypothetical protein BDV98DRAFT_596877 [Pterula gracilis]